MALMVACIAAMSAGRYYLCGGNGGPRGGCKGGSKSRVQQDFVVECPNGALTEFCYSFGGTI